MYSPEERGSGNLKTSALMLFDRERSKQRCIRLSQRPVDSSRLLASAKLVYGGVFSGYRASIREKERHVIDLLVSISESFMFIPSKRIMTHYRALRAGASAILTVLKEIISPGVQLRLERFAANLLNPKTTLRWNIRSNSCQTFANNLLRGDFQGLYPMAPVRTAPKKHLAPPSNDPWSQYLFCFKNTIDSPSHWNLSLQCRSIIWQFYGWSRDDCDLIEFSEWKIHDEPLEARKSLEVLLLQDQNAPEDTSAGGGKAGMADALWSLPRDSLSLLQTHLLRRPEKYCNPEGLALTKEAWVSNRLRVLQQLDVFACLGGGLASAWLDQFERYPEDLRELIFPDSEMYGTLRAEEQMVTIQLGPVNMRTVKGRSSDGWREIGRGLIRQSGGAARLKASLSSMRFSAAQKQS